ncbi:MAG: hypothetical protein DRQ39_11500 [Gammaproteobacteria bacterium]|nr:MAG: hypothetical protein DRQ39_11500 [Gammaproteobacteria bacterium]
MESVLAVLFVLGLGGSTVDIVKDTNYVETAFRVVCVKTGGKWEGQGMPGAACVGQERDIGKET